MSSNKRQRDDDISKCQKRIKVLERQVERLMTDNDKLKSSIIMVDTKDSLKRDGFLTYKSLINKRVEELLKYIKCFNELKKVSQERIHFMVHNCYELIVDVYKRHPFSFEKEYNRFKQVVNFLTDLCENKEYYLLLYNTEYKLSKIYYLTKEDTLRIDSYIAMIFSSFKLGYIMNSKNLIRTMKDNVKMNKISEDQEEFLQFVKDEIYK